MRWPDRLVALAIVAVWGFNFVVMRWGVSGIPPFMLGGLRFATVVACAALLVPRPAIPWRWLAVYGLCVGLLQFGCLFSAIRVGMPAGLASIVLQAQALFTLLIALLWQGERFTRWQLAGLLTGGAGLWLLGGKGAVGIPPAGFVLTLLAALAWATSNVVVRAIVRAGHTPDTLGLVVWSGLFPIVPFLGVSLLVERDQVRWDDVLTLRSLFAVGYLALVSTLFGYTQWSRLLSRYPASVVAPYSLLVPFFGVLSSALVLGERLTPWQLAGGGVLLLGLAVHVLGPRLSARRGAAPGARPAPRGRR